MEKRREGTKKIRKGDNVLVVAGESKGKAGVVLSRMGEKAIVQGVNIRKKHLKRTQQTPGRIVEIERPVHISNLRICIENDAPVKLKVRTNKDGDRQFIYQNNGQEVVYRSVKKPSSSR